MFPENTLACLCQEISDWYEQNEQYILSGQHHQEATLSRREKLPGYVWAVHSRVLVEVSVSDQSVNPAIQVKIEYCLRNMRSYETHISTLINRYIVISSIQ